MDYQKDTACQECNSALGHTFDCGNTTQKILDREYIAYRIAVEEMPEYADSWNFNMQDAEGALLELLDEELISRYKETHGLEELDKVAFK